MAIHKVLLKPDTELKAYKKEFRKCLMTGGAVVEISDEIDESSALKLIEVFSVDAVPNGVQRLVLKELKSRFSDSSSVAKSLEKLSYSV